MRTALIGLAAVIAALSGGAEPAGAQYWQGKGTWCIVPPAGGGTWDCSYYSYGQCQQTASGGRGTCSQSPAAEWERRLGKNKSKNKNKQRDY